MATGFRMILLKPVCLLIALFSFSTLYSQELNYTPPTTRILFILDASQSMLSQWESGKKMDVAKRMLTNMVDSMKTLPYVEMALRVYGHQSPVPPQDCSDTKLEVPFGKDNSGKIMSVINNLRPKGTTPIAYSLELAGSDFPSCTNCRNIIILITDGIESCDGDPCAVSFNLQKKGIVLRPFVIGIGLDVGFRESFDCVGKFYNATNEERFKEVLEVVVSQALNTTTAQVNLLDINGMPTETNVAMSFYDSFSGLMKYNFVHTINNRGNPDTLRLDPLPMYRVMVHTVPPVIKDSIVLVAGKHNIVAIDAPQGDLEVKTFSQQHYRDLQCIVRKAGETQTLNLQAANRKNKYLTGRYDLEILTLPRIMVPGVEISQSYTTTIKIPNPGMVNFVGYAPFYGSVFVEEGSDIRWIFDLNAELTQQTLVLQPGNYRVICRAKNARESLYTINRSFTVAPNGNLRIDLR